MSTKSPWKIMTTLGVVIVLLIFAVPQLVAEPRDKSSDDMLRVFEYVYHYIQNNYVEEVDPEVLMQGALKGMFESLEDPYSVYLSPSDMRDLMDTTEGEFGGIGLYISKPAPGSADAVDLGRYIEVVAPIEGKPGFRAGIIAGDYITHINSEPVDDQNIDEVLKLLRGTPGTEVTITILRGKKHSFDVDLVRENIPIPTVKYELMDNGYGFLRIIQFTPRTPDLVKEALVEFRKKGFSGLIIDLRSNPGGLLSSVQQTGDLFFDRGLIVEQKGRAAGENEQYYAKPGKEINNDIPIVVLVNNGSASAAEILAGVLKDRDRAYLIGETTYGKGTVQKIRGIFDSGFKLTEAKYYTPSGNTIHEVGIEPHQLIELPEISEEEVEAYIELRETNKLEEFALENLDASKSEISRFARKLVSEGYAISQERMEIYVKAEINRHLSSPPLYDLDHDKILQAALEYLESL